MVRLRVLVAGILLVLPSSAFAAPAAVAAQAPAGPRQYTIQQFLDTVRYSGASFSADGSKILVTSDRTGIQNAFAVPVAGGEPVALTHSTTDNIDAQRYFPHDERFLYSADTGGNELDHVFVQDAAGKVRDLTPGAKLKAQFLDFSADGAKFWIATNERDERFFDVYEYASDGYARTLIYKDDAGLQIAAIAPDGGALAFVKAGGSTADSDVLLWRRGSAEVKNLTAHTGDEANLAQAFSRDGKALLLTTDRGGEFARLVAYDLASGRVTDLVKADWDVAGAYLSRDGRHLVAAINNDARTELRMYAWPAMTAETLPTLPAADVSLVEFSPDGKTLALYAETARAPRDLFVTAFNGTPRRLTHSLSAAISPDDLVDAQMVRFKSYDGVEVPGILYQPQNGGAKAPTLVSVHGGPGGQSRVGYSALVQYLVNHGYAVYAINNRGSSGYGKTFYAMDDRKHGEADLDDCVAAKRMLAARQGVDGERIGIMGGSYGGYMVLAALAFRPQEFRVGVDLYGVANWPRTLSSIPAWWESFRKALYKEMGDPVADAAYLKRISPLFHPEGIERPLIVIQGENDPRVLRTESDEIVAAVKKKGVPVEYVLFPDEGHGIVKKVNQVKAYEAILAFLDHHLAAAAAGAAAAPGGR
jgi:dipeptidyl aminopeptidase/acylaminoacyl peptidase